MFSSELHRSHRALELTSSSYSSSYSTSYGGDDHHYHDTPNEIWAAAIFGIVCAIVFVTLCFEFGKVWLLNVSLDEMKPVVHQLFAEMSVLGFISLCSFASIQSGWLETLSIEFFGDTEHGAEQLLHLLEIVHYSIFMVMVVFIAEVLLLIRVGDRLVHGWRVEHEFAVLLDEACREDANARSIADHLPLLAPPGGPRWKAIVEAGVKRSLSQAVASAAAVAASAREEIDFTEAAMSPRSSFQKSIRKGINELPLELGGSFVSNQAALTFWGMRREFLRDRCVHSPHAPSPLSARPPANFDYAKYLEYCLSRDLVAIVHVGWGCWLTLLVVAAFWSLLVSVLLNHSPQALIWSWIGFEYVLLLGWLFIRWCLQAIGKFLVDPAALKAVEISKHHMKRTKRNHKHHHLLLWKGGKRCSDGEAHAGEDDEESQKQEQEQGSEYEQQQQWHHPQEQGGDGNGSGISLTSPRLRNLGLRIRVDEDDDEEDDEVKDSGELKTERDGCGGPSYADDVGGGSHDDEDEDESWSHLPFEGLGSREAGSSLARVSTLNLAMVSSSTNGTGNYDRSSGRSNNRRVTIVEEGCGGRGGGGGAEPPYSIGDRAALATASLLISPMTTFSDSGSFSPEPPISTLISPTTTRTAHHHHHFRDPNHDATTTTNIGGDPIFPVSAAALAPDRPLTPQPVFGRNMRNFFRRNSSTILSNLPATVTSTSISCFASTTQQHEDGSSSLSVSRKKASLDYSSGFGGFGGYSDSGRLKKKIMVKGGDKEDGGGCGSSAVGATSVKAAAAAAAVERPALARSASDDETRLAAAMAEAAEVEAKVDAAGEAPLWTRHCEENGHESHLFACRILLLNQAVYISILFTVILPMAVDDLAPSSSHSSQSQSPMGCHSHLFIAILCIVALAPVLAFAPISAGIIGRTVHVGSVGTFRDQSLVLRVTRGQKNERASKLLQVLNALRKELLLVSVTNATSNATIVSANGDDDDAGAGDGAGGSVAVRAPRTRSISGRVNYSKHGSSGPYDDDAQRQNSATLHRANTVIGYGYPSRGSPAGKVLTRQRSSVLAKFQPTEGALVERQPLSEAQVEALAGLLPKGKREAVQRAFNLYDRDGSGSLNFAELKGLMLSLGHPLPSGSHRAKLADVEVAVVMRSLDLDGDGTVSWPEFLSWSVANHSHNAIHHHHYQPSGHDSNSDDDDDDDDDDNGDHHGGDDGGGSGDIDDDEDDDKSVMDSSSSSTTSLKTLAHGDADVLPMSVRRTSHASFSSTFKKMKKRRRKQKRQQKKKKAMKVTVKQRLDIVAQEIFDMFDDGKRGRVTISEFQAGFARFGVDLEENEMLVLVEELDEDRSGDISVEDIKNLLKVHNTPD